MPLDGSFDIDGREFHYEIVEIYDYDGNEITGADIEEGIEEADRVFYSAEADGGETYYRWLGGPFESLDQIEEAIHDEADVYEGT